MDKFYANSIYTVIRSEKHLVPITQTLSLSLYHMATAGHELLWHIIAPIVSVYPPRRTCFRRVYIMANYIIREMSENSLACKYNLGVRSGEDIICN